MVSVGVPDGISVSVGLPDGVNAGSATSTGKFNLEVLPEIISVGGMSPPPSTIPSKSVNISSVFELLFTTYRAPLSDPIARPSGRLNFVAPPLISPRKSPVQKKLGGASQPSVKGAKILTLLSPTSDTAIMSSEKSESERTAIFAGSTKAPAVVPV